MRNANVKAGPIEHHTIAREKHMTRAARKRWAGQATWDMEHFSVVSTKLTKEEAAEFRRLCAVRRSTPYSVIGALVRLWMDGMQAYEEDEKNGKEERRHDKS